MKPVTEQDRDEVLSWYSQETPSIDALIEKLNTEYEHDYGTICHAIAAVAVQAARKMNAQSQGGITGFQVGAVMWEFIRQWMNIEGPLRLVKYNNMLYPQNFEQFDTKLSRDVWQLLQEEAERLMTESNPELVHKDVYAHWAGIVEGVVPFGYVVDNQE